MAKAITPTIMIVLSKMIFTFRVTLINPYGRDRTVFCPYPKILK